MDKFDNHGEVSLVPGDILGIRAFKVNSHGVLLGPHTDFEWQNGENQGGCTIMDDTYLWPSTRQFWKDNGGHRVAHPDCSCGFYAYFYENPNQYHSPRYQGTVAGIVRGTGKATVGTHGFRIEKAEIVALVEPNERDFVDEPQDGFIVIDALPLPWWKKPFVKLAKFVHNHPDAWFAMMMTTAAVFLLGSIAAGIFVTPWLALGAILMVPTIVGGAEMDLYARGEPWKKYETHKEYTGMSYSKLTREAWAKVLENYPDARVYKTLAEAKVAHPMTFHPGNTFTIPKLTEEVN